MIRQSFILAALLTLFPVQVAQAYYFRHLGPENGMANPSVLSICQDSLGRMWFGTENGVSIFNGEAFTSYCPFKSYNGELFQNNSVRRVLCDTLGNVFFETSLGIIKHDVRTDAIKALPLDNVSDLFQEDGEVYAIRNSELLRYDQHSNDFVHSRTLPVRQAYSYVKAKDGRVWMINYDGLFVEDSSGEVKKVCSYTELYSIFISSSGEVWAGSLMNGLLRIMPDGTQITYNQSNSSGKGFNCDNVREITEDKDGNLWFGTFNGLYRYDIKQDSFASYTRGDKAGELSHSSVHSVFIDRDSTLWVGTYFGGVNYVDISRSSFRFYPAGESEKTLSHPVVGNMVEDKDGNIWICTEGGGLNMLDPSTGRITRFRSDAYPFALPHTNLKCVDYDGETQKLYIGTTSKGLYSYDLASGKFENLIKVRSNDSFSDIINVNKIIRYKGKLFLSTNSGVYVYPLETETRPQPQCVFRTRQRAFPFAADREHRLWITTGTKVDVMDMDTYEILKTYYLNVEENHVRSLQIYCNDEDEIFVSTYGYGIMKLDQDADEFKTYYIPGNKSLNMFCYQMAQAPSGNMILTGEKGMDITNESAEVLKSYPIVNPLPLNSIVVDCGMLVARDGTIYVGGTNGLIAFNEDNLKSESVSEGKVYFSNLYVNGTLVKPDDKSRILANTLPYTSSLKLTHKQSKIEIIFFSAADALGFNPSDYEYRLEGFDQDWFPASSNRITYTNLPAGKYELLIERRGSVREKKAASLEIRVLPPWFLTWWALLLWTALLSLASIEIVHIHRARKADKETIRKERMEKESIKAVNEAKLRFFTSVSHEFRTPLTLICSQIDLILQSNKLPPLIYNKMVRIMHQSKQLGNLVTELIEFRKCDQEKFNVTRNSLNEFVLSVFDKFKELSEQKEIDYNLILPDEDPIVYFDERNMERVLMNIISNAFKYTKPKGHVSVTVDDSDGKAVEVHVKDDGKGIPKEEIPRIFDRFYRADNNEQGNISGSGIGLALVKTIMDKHKGQVSVVSEEGKGSEFILTLLLGKDHLEGDYDIIIQEDKSDYAVSSAFFPAEDAIETEDEDAEDENAAVGEHSPSVPTAADSIVIAEDNKELLSILNELFSPIYNVYTAENGKDALDIVRNVKPSLVVSDVMMPVMSGTELCSNIKGDIELSHIPVVLLTALDLPEQYLDGLLKGADDYISKPFEAKILLARCNNIIRSRKVLYKQIKKDPSPEISVLATNKLDKDFLDRFTKFIDEEISNSLINNDEIARKMGMSRSSFYNKFRNLTGETPNEFISSYRLKKSAVLLVDNQGMNITEISEATGFNSSNYFSRQFKEHFGMTPLQYRHNNSQKKQ